jgi:hypothetical protein
MVRLILFCAVLAFASGAEMNCGKTTTALKATFCASATALGTACKAAPAGTGATVCGACKTQCTTSQTATASVTGNNEQCTVDCGSASSAAAVGFAGAIALVLLQ